MYVFLEKPLTFHMGISLKLQDVFPVFVTEGRHQKNPHLRIGSCSKTASQWIIKVNKGALVK